VNYKEIISSIRNKNLQPVYFLMGEEPYYIDQLAYFFLNNIIPTEEQAFNQIILYGKDCTTEQIIAECKQFPFGSTKRVVVIKEAQHLKDIEIIDSYLKDPQKSSVLVICYKGKSIDKRKKFGKGLASKCIVFESKKIYDNEIPNWVKNHVIGKGLKINHQATAVLAEYIGNDLSRITNEIDKLTLTISQDTEITTTLIERHIGISKDYNIFELQNALGKRRIAHANKIINHFSENPKNHNIIPIISSLFSYFQKIMTYHFLEDKSPKIAASILKVHPFFMSQYEESAKNYNKKQLFYIFEYLKEYDLRSKGIKNRNISNQELLKELVFKILHI